MMGGWGRGCEGGVGGGGVGWGGVWGGGVRGRGGDEGISSNPDFQSATD